MVAAAGAAATSHSMLTSDTATQVPRLTMRGISRAFGATQALAGVDLSVRAGEVLALVGENGAGKSTLMKVLSGACRPDAGEMSLDGCPFRPQHPQAARAAGVCMVYQELALAPHLDVTGNILLGNEPCRAGLLQRAEMETRAGQALAQLGRADIPLRTAVRDLPLATRQIVEIARAVASRCRVLVLDEPSSSLSAADTQSLFALVRRLAAQGQAIIYISHFMEEVRAISNRFTVLRDGRTVGEGSTPGTDGATLVRMMVGREMTDLYPRSPRQPGEAVLALEALRGVGKPLAASLELRRGEVLGIAGIVGAGRTELLRAVFGLDAVRSGRVTVAGYCGAASPARRWAQGVGMVSEDRKLEGLALGLSLADNVTLAHLCGLGPAGLVLPSRQAAAAARWIDGLQIKCRAPEQRVGDLSGGNQQKVALARLLHRDADVFLLDEPTRGIDVGSKAQIYALIDRQAARGRAVLMVSSYLPELLGVCDRIAVMCRGILQPARRAADCSEHQIMLQATGATPAEQP